MTSCSMPSPSSVGKLSTSLEELSLRKQLPLRQQADKPVLKYSSNSKPIHLYEKRDATAVKKGGSSPSLLQTVPSGASGYGYTNHHAHMVSGPFKPKPPAAPYLAKNAGSNSAGSSPLQNRSRYTSPQRSTPSSLSPSSGSPLSSSTKLRSDPYSRPISAKDVEEKLQQSSTNSALRKSLSGSALKSLAINSGVSGLKGQRDIVVPASNPPLPNAFLRPKSALKTTEPSNKPPPSPVKDSPGSKSNNVNSLQGSSALAKGSARSETVKTVAKGNGPPPKPPPGTRPRSARPPSAMLVARPSSAKVRNPNYTPVKPYSDISREGSNESIDSGKVSNDSNNNGSKNGIDTSDSDSERKSAGGSNSSSSLDKAVKLTSTTEPLLQSSGSDNETCDKNNSTTPMKKMPVTGTLIDGTMFYRKDSREEQKIADYGVVRPKAEGAPAKTNTVENSSLKSPSSLKKVVAHPQSGRSVKSTVSRMSSAVDDEADDGEWEDEGEVDDDDDDDYDDGDYDDVNTNSERLPADGESFGDDIDDDDDDMLDNLDDDVVDDSDAESDTYSIGSAVSKRSSATSVRSTLRCKSAKTRPAASTILRENATLSSADVRTLTTRPKSAALRDYELQPALTASLFSNVPPTINFVADGEKVESLPWEIKKLLKWRLSPVTPNVVKNCINRSGFRITKKNHDWLGCWGKHMKANAFRAIREYQKLNHFPGSFQIGRKDRLWRNLSRLQVHFGRREFGFFPQTFVLPYDMKLLKRAWEDGGSKQKWIIKPPASARGIGIKVIHKWNQVPKRRPVIVQKYLSRPYLINESKFDLRIYVYVTSLDPLRLYVFQDGLVRFASMKYSSSMKNLNNKYMHLTNYSINKKNSGYQANGDDTVCQGHKWSLKSLWGYLQKKGVNYGPIWESIKDLVIKTIVCAEAPMNSLVKSNCQSTYSVHELFGFDVMLDEQLKPWILEVNISPSLHSNSQLDMNVKGQMIKDLHNLAGFQIPDKNEVVQNQSAPADTSSIKVPSELIMDKRLFTQNMAPDERAKHAYYCQKYQDDQIQQSVLDTLTPDDIRVLIATVDEDSRKGGFERVFPTAKSSKYLKFFEQPRYYNLLLNQWVQRYNKMEARGVALLDSFCQKWVHVQSPTTDPYHQWSPPNATPRTLSAPSSKPGVGNSSSTSQLPKLRKKNTKPIQKMSHSGSASSLDKYMMPSNPQSKQNR